MKRSDRCCKKMIIAMMLVLFMMLLGALPALAGSGLSLTQKFGLKIKKNLGSTVTMNQTLMNVKLPLKISKMPGAWKNAGFVGLALVYFLDGTGEPVGYGFSTNGEMGMPLNVSLSNGSYNGTVVFPIQQVAGQLTGKTCSVGMVMAKLGSQAMFIGGSKGGTAPNSSVCANIGFVNAPPGMIIGQ